MSITHNLEQGRYQVQRRCRASRSLKRNNSPTGRYYLHSKDRGRGGLAGKEQLRPLFLKLRAVHSMDPQTPGRRSAEPGSPPSRGKQDC